MADLDTDLIISTALRVVDRGGADGFTMRAVADELGVTSAALYRHVVDKKALVGLVVNAVVAEQILPEPTGDWREDIWLVAKSMREMMRTHPNVSDLSRGQPIWSTTVLPITERWMSLWMQSGLPMELALRGAVATSLAITGIAGEELRLRGMRPPSPEALTWVPSARKAFGLRRDADADYELVVRALVDGVHASLMAEHDRATA